MDKAVPGSSEKSVLSSNRLCVHIFQGNSKEVTLVIQAQLRPGGLLKAGTELWWGGM